MKKFFTLPFNYKNYVVGGGWFYDPTDLIVQSGGDVSHYSIDFDLPQNTPVLAAADGWALSSYHRRLVRNPSDKRKFIRLKGKLVGSAQGNFVIIYHPQQKLFTQYGHLERVLESIPFYEPHKGRGVAVPPTPKFQASFFGKKTACWVKRGEQIGWVGSTGIGEWVDSHIHFEVYQYRDKDGGKPKDSYLDPYDIRKSSKYYPWPSHQRKMGEKHLWLLNKDGLPAFPSSL